MPTSCPEQQPRSASRLLGGSKGRRGRVHVAAVLGRQTERLGARGGLDEVVVDSKWVAGVGQRSRFDVPVQALAQRLDLARLLRLHHGR